MSVHIVLNYVTALNIVDAPVIHKGSCCEEFLKANHFTQKCQILLVAFH